MTEKPRNDGKTGQRGAEKAGAEDQRPDGLEKEDKAALDQVQEVADAENEQGFRGQEVDSTPNENYTVTGDHSQTPEAQADPAAARLKAANPDAK